MPDRVFGHAFCIERVTSALSAKYWQETMTYVCGHVFVMNESHRLSRLSYWQETRPYVCGHVFVMNESYRLSRLSYWQEPRPCILLGMCLQGTSHISSVGWVTDMYSNWFTGISSWARAHKPALDMSHHFSSGVTGIYSWTWAHKLLVSQAYLIHVTSS